MSNKEILKTLLEKILNNNLTILEKKNEIELNDIKYCKENIKNFESKNLFKFKIFIESLNECKSFQIKSEENQNKSKKKKEKDSQNLNKNIKSQTNTKENLSTRNSKKKLQKSSSIKMNSSNLNKSYNFKENNNKGLLRNKTITHFQTTNPKSKTLIKNKSFGNFLKDSNTKNQIKNSLNKEKKNLLNENKTFLDKINAIKNNFNEEELNQQIKPIEYTRGALKALSLLNEPEYQKIFDDDTIPSSDLILVYKIYFQLINKDTDIINLIHNSSDEALIWENIFKYIKSNTEDDKLGDLFKEELNNMDCSIENIFNLINIVNQNKNKDKLNPLFYSKLCPTTGLLIFLIKESLDYLGVLESNKTPPQRLIQIYQHYIDLNKEKLEDINKKLNESDNNKNNTNNKNNKNNNSISTTNKINNNNNTINKKKKK